MAEAPLTKKRSAANAIVFLGGGRITSALLAGLRLAGYRKPIVVHDRHPEKLLAIKRQFRIETASDLALALQRSEVLIIAVRPSSVAQLLHDVAQVLRRVSSRPLLAISLAAGVPLRRLRGQLAPPVRWARAMPSPVCRIGRGLTALSFDRRATDSDRNQARKFFQNVGSVLEISESKIDAFTATFSPSHGYHALFTLAKAAEATGLDRKVALAAACHALAEGILYWRDGSQRLQDLLHEAATPGGTAAATMKAMDKAGFEESVLQGLRAGIERARRNADCD
jgi:pyrroline-5-carboxylate reductase